MIDIFSIFHFELEIYCQHKFQKLSQLTNRNSVENFKIELDVFRKKNA